jgi:hypothetical protein
MGEVPHCVAAKTLFNLNELIHLNDLNNWTDFNNLITFPRAAQRQSVLGK